MSKPAVCIIPTCAAAASCLLVAGSLLPGCVRAAEEDICPPLAPGALVVTELRVAQSETVADGDPRPVAAFVEVFNASDAEIDLRGLVFSFRSIDGGDISRAIVRDQLDVAAGAYLALSPSDAARADVAPLAPTFGYDLDQDIPGNAQLIVTACGVELDRILYRVLPTSGSLAFGAVAGKPPTATDNDLETAWCVQGQSPSDEFGSPSAANASCEEPIQ